MKPLYFNIVNQTTHVGLCSHLDMVDPDSICIVETDMLGSGGIIIARKADIQWNAIQQWEASVGNEGFTWCELKQRLLN